MCLSPLPSIKTALDARRPDWGGARGVEALPMRQVKTLTMIGEMRVLHAGSSNKRVILLTTDRSSNQIDVVLVNDRGTFESNDSGIACGARRSAIADHELFLTGSGYVRTAALRQGERPALRDMHERGARPVLNIATFAGVNDSALASDNRGSFLADTDRTL
jgi:hypothetical protein